MCGGAAEMAEQKIPGNPEGCYANFLKIGQNAFEILLDFGQLYSDEEARFTTRIITTPVYAKAFLGVLRDCISRYEQTFGTIPEEEVEFEING